LSTTSISGGGNHNVVVYGSGSVVAGDGNDRVMILGGGNVTLGSGRDTVTIAGNGTVSAGSGNDSIRLNSGGSISVGGGNDTLALNGSGQITENGLLGNDTINLGLGSDTIYVEGSATVQSANLFQRTSHGRFGFGRDPGPGSGVNATVAGGELAVGHVGVVTQETAISGAVTLLGGASSVEFVGGSGSTVMKGGSGNDTFIGGSGEDTMTGGTGNNLFEFLASAQGGQHVITNFVASDQLNVEGHTLSYLLANGEVTTSNGNTYISIDGGKTTIELKGFTEAPETRHHPIFPHGTKDL
jgi:Ca2+-binding RTX toxin-like protein